MEGDRFYPISEPWPFAPRPVIGEHVLGYVRRLCEANGMDTMRAFWATTGLSTLCPWSADSLWLQVQGLTGFCEEDINRLRWSRSGGQISVKGLPIRQRLLDNIRLRHCPDCLSEGSTLRPTWSIFHVTACERHANQLEDTCGNCGAELRLMSKTTIWDCPVCGTDIRTHKGRPAREEALELAATVHAHFDPDTAQRPLICIDVLTLNQLLTLVDRLGTLASVNPDDDRPTSIDKTYYGIGDLKRSGGLAAARDIVIAGVQVLREWPQAYHDLLANFMDRNLAPTQRNLLRRRFATKFGLLAIRPILDFDGTPIQFASNELQRFCLDRLKYRWGQRKRSHQAEMESHFGHRRNTGGLTILPLPDPDELPAKLVPIMDKYMAIEDAMNILEGSPSAKIAPWLESGLLSQRNGKILLIEKRQVWNLVGQMKALTSNATKSEGGIKIGHVRSFRDPYRRSNFLRDIFSGSIRLYADGEFAGLRSLSIDWHELSARRALTRLQSMIQHDRYVQIHELNPLLELLWGPTASFNLAEAQRWVLEGSVRHRYEAPISGKSSYPRHSFHPIDIVRKVQSSFRLMYFDLMGEPTAARA